VEGMGSCLAPEGPAAGAQQVPGGAGCLSVGVEQCQQRRGEWLGPRPPPQWQRLKGTLNPCYSDGPGGRVRCLPLVLNLAPSKSGTEDLYKRLLAHPAVVKNDAFGSTGYEGFYASKEPTFWTHAEVDNYTLEDFAQAYDQLAVTVADMAKVQGRQTPTSSRLLNFMKMFRKKRRREPAGIANAVGIDFSAVTMDASPALIFAAMPESRFVALMRDPLKRAESQWNFAFARIDSKGCPLAGKHTQEKYHETAAMIVGEFNGCTANASPVDCWRLMQKRRTWGCRQWATSAKFILWSLYGVYLPWFLEYFPREQMFVRRLEDVDFVNNKTLAEKNMIELYSFIGIEPELNEHDRVRSFRSTHYHTHSDAADYTHMSNQTQALLQEFYDPYVKKLQEAFHDPGLAWW